MINKPARQHFRKEGREKICDMREALASKLKHGSAVRPANFSPDARKMRLSRATGSKIEHDRRACGCASGRDSRFIRGSFFRAKPTDQIHPRLSSGENIFHFSPKVAVSRRPQRASVSVEIRYNPWESVL